MADEQKPAGAPSPAPPGAGGANPKAGAAAGASKPAPPTPAAAAAPPKPPATMAAIPWDSDLVRDLRDRFGEQIGETSSYLGQDFLVAKPDAVTPVLEYLKLEGDFDYLVDITAVDWPKKPERFELVYILYSFSHNRRVRVKTSIADGYRPASAVSVHRTANWLEREVYDMFGIEFAGHPDLRRILLPEDWQGFPLRKEYSILQQDERWVQENLGIESGQ